MIISLQNSAAALTVLLRADIDPRDAVLLGHTLDEAILARPPQIRVDTAHVTYCGAAAIAALVGARNDAQRARVSFTLQSPSRIVRRVLDITNLTDWFDIGWAA